MTPPDAAAATPAAPIAPPRAAVSLLVAAARPDLRRIARGCVWLVLAAALEALTPVLGKFFIDRYLVPRQLDLPAIAGLLAVALAAGWLASFLRYGQLLRLAAVAMRSVRRLREQVYAHVLRLPMAYFDRAMTGQLVSRITNDTEAVQRLYVQLLFVLLDSLIMIASVLLTFALLDPWLMAVAALLVPAVLGIVQIYRHYSAAAVARTRALRGDLNAQVGEAIAGMAVLQAAGAASRFEARYRATNQGYYDSRRTELRANAWLLRPALDLLHMLMLVVVLAVYGWRDAGSGSGLVAVTPLQVGVLYAFVSTLGRLVEPLIQLTMQFAQVQQSVVAAQRLQALLHEPAEAWPSEAWPSESGQAQAGQAQAGNSNPAVRPGAVHIEHLNFAYTPGRPVLRDIALDIAPGQFIGIVGPTGSGKTSLLGLLLRFYALNQGTGSGRILLDGRPIEQWPDTALRATLGLVPQDPFLLASSVRDNIAMDRPMSDAAVQAAAEAAGAHGFITRLPQGYDTPLGEGGARLAAGEKQLLAIARALAGQPRVLLLDEATSHIDSETEAQVQRALSGLRGRLTVIAIAHRLATIRDADQIVVLHHGRIAEQGPHEALMAHEQGLYRRLVQLQQLQHEVESATQTG
jgi:ATP-binding cassette subfamily B protein/ATP-binding cassette subfamily C protein/ATP-binding cassette subfamily B multidrug efflux pump